MKVLKPRQLGVLVRTIERDRRFHFTASILGMFPFGSPTRLFPEAEMWKFCAKALGKDPILDEALPKVRGELLVTGSAFNPAGPKPSCVVRARLAKIDKSLRVVGDRFWPYDARSNKLANKATEPAPFDEMPIDWERAYGGKGYAKNPTGRGYWTSKTLEQAPVPLPNVEAVDDPVLKNDARHEPVGFGGYDITWPQRFSKVGTYDREWLDKQFPGLALDMDPSLFNVAPADQQIEGFFRGDEAFEVLNMHPKKERVAGSLPGLVGRCFVTLRTTGGDVFREIAMRAETVRLFPAAERGVVIFRGTIEIAEDDGDDVVHLLVAAEKLGGAPLPVRHYEEVLAHRLDRKRGAAYALRDRDLVPEPDPDAPLVDGSPDDALKELFRPKLLIGEAMLRRQAAEIAKAREAVLAAGLDPSAWDLPDVEANPPVPEDPVERAEYQERMLEKTKALAAEEQDKALARARADCAAMGVDYDALVAKAREESGGPPRFSAKAEMSRLRALVELAKIGGFVAPEAEARANDPAYEAKLERLEELLLGGYRKNAHLFPAAPAASSELTRKVRDELARTPRPSFARRDLTGVDLAGLDLSGCDFTEALLECASLDGARLGGVKLAGAVLARATLVAASLDTADLTRANLGGADLTRATLRGAVLARAVLANAVLDDAIFDGATLDDADVSGAVLTGTSFARARAARVGFSAVRLSRVSFDDADMPRARFVQCALDDVTFCRAKLFKATFTSVNATRVKLDDARMEGARFSQASDFSGASFARALLERANLRETVLEDADFGAAHLSHADLSKSKLARANFHLAVLREARFDRADLTRARLTQVDGLLASFSKANLSGADLRGSSLFGADLLRIVVDTGTLLEGAWLERVRYVPRRGPGGS